MATGATGTNTICHITCPRCGHVETEQMPTDACVFFYDCPGCGGRLKPKAGQCCVFCSYGDVLCPPNLDSKRFAAHVIDTLSHRSQ